jgi:hypothetical protein
LDLIYFGGNEINSCFWSSLSLILKLTTLVKKKSMSGRSNRNKSHQTVHENELNPNNKKSSRNKKRDLRKEDSGEEVSKSTPMEVSSKNSPSVKLLMIKSLKKDRK